MRVTILATALLVLSLSAASAEDNKSPAAIAQSDSKAQAPQDSPAPDQAIPRQRADRDGGRDGERNVRRGDGGDRDRWRDAERDRGERDGDRRERGDRDLSRRDRGSDDSLEDVRPRHRIKICVEQDNGDEVCRYTR
jgi:hypothetical protein